jgi:hypothetical protein
MSISHAWAVTHLTCITTCTWPACGVVVAKMRSSQDSYLGLFPIFDTNLSSDKF